MNTFYTKKTDINPSDYVCPKDKKHKLRLSTDRRYSDLWCDCCVNGWTISAIQQVSKEKTVELLIPCGEFDYVGIYLKITPAVKKELKEYKETVMKLSPRLSLMISISGMTNSSFALACSRLDFENDKDHKFKDSVEDELCRNKIIEVATLKHKLDLNSHYQDNLADLDRPESHRKCNVIMNSSGLKFECPHEDLMTPVIPWSKLIQD